MNNIYTILSRKIGHKIIQYRKEWNKAGRNGYTPIYPLHLNFEIESGCNFECDFCIHSVPLKERNYKSNVSKKISFKKYREIIDNGIANNLYSVELNGINEPLLTKNIEQYIKYANDKNILITSLHTNGSLLNERRAEKIIDSCLTILIFSVDAITRETYKGIRKNNRYDTVFNNINNFLKIRKKIGKNFPLVQMSFVKNKFNYRELEEYIKYWKNKVDFISTSTFCNPFIETKREEEVENRYRLENFIGGDCVEPYQRLFIRNDGKVHACCSFFGGEFIVGDIYKNSISQIWNGEKIKQVRLGLKTGKIRMCKRCHLSMNFLYNKKDTNGKN